MNGRCLYLVIFLFLCVATEGLTFHEKVERLQLDLNYVTTHAKSMVDVVFVLDASGSIDPAEFEQSKTFIKTFLEYFSIAPGHGQVGVVTYASMTATAIPLRVDGNKCQLMKDLSKISRVKPDVGAATNTKLGLEQAWNVFRGRDNSRRSNALRVLVLITDGGWTMGGDPMNIITPMKNDPGTDGGIHFLVVSVGVDSYYQAQMENWASKVGTKPMTIDVTDYHRLAQMAYAIHNGTHESYYTDISNSECQAAALNCQGSSRSSSAACMCDSFGITGDPHCGCKIGKYVTVLGSKYRCSACAKGTYQDTRNIKQNCKPCPAQQTTLSAGATASTDCRCQTGYWDPVTRSKSPSDSSKCEAVTCRRDLDLELDANSVDVVGVCSYRYGESCHYSCRRGHFYGGRMERICTETGSMDKALPLCSVVSCPALTKDDNSEAWSCEYNGRLQNPPYIYGTVCSSSCKAGYSSANSTSGIVECIAESNNHVKWSSKALQCAAKQCRPLPEIVNGHYDYTYCSDPKLLRTLGVRCQAVCKPGFKSQHNVEWTCENVGTWTNKDVRVVCEDIQPPVFQNCPPDQVYTNVPYEGYYEWKLPIPKVKDNGPDSMIEQSVTIKQRGQVDQDLECTVTDCSYGYAYIGPRAEVIHTAVDQAGNIATCKYHVLVKDNDKPTVSACGGPVTKNGIIETDGMFADITWETPTFADNSALPLRVSSNWMPGRFAVGKTYDVTYTAVDQDDNVSNCSFSFKVVNKKKNCPQLHVPANGHLTCYDMAFGHWCAPLCDPKYIRLPGRLPLDYFCKNGSWLPHNQTGDCAVKTENTHKEIVVKDYCEDDKSKLEIIAQALQAIQDHPLRFPAKEAVKKLTKKQLDNIIVYCGPQNRTIVALPDDVYDYNY